MRTPRYPLPPLGTVLIGAAAAIGVLLSLLFAAVTLPVLLLIRLGSPRAADAPNRRPPC